MTLSPAEAESPSCATPASLAPRTFAASRLDRVLRRCAAHEVQFLVTGPTDPRMSAGTVTRFPGRRPAPGALVQWEAACRRLAVRSREAHDRGSWRVLAVSGDRVVGMITARFFARGLVPEYLHTQTLLEQTGPVLREHCERAIAEAFGAAQRAGRTLAEISHWVVEPQRGGAWIAAGLLRAMGALLAAMDSPLILIAADHRRGEVPRLMRLGAAPLGCAGKFALPPFVHHATGAWLRLLLLDAPTFQLRYSGAPALDLACLRERLPVLTAN